MTPDFKQRFGERLARGEMQIGEKNLPFAQQLILGRQRFFHFHDHLRARENIFRVVDDLRAGRDVIWIGITGANARAFFHQDGMTAPRQL